MFPLIANAQTAIRPDYVNSIIEAVGQWINMLVPLLIGLAVVVFFYGLVKYIWGGAEAKAAAISSMVWGVIAIAVMVSIWGLVGLLQDISNIDKNSQADGGGIAPDLPRVERNRW